MKPLNFFQRGEWISRLISFAVILTTFTTGILLIEPVAWAGGTVTSPTEAGLRAAMAGGGTVTFAFDGTITLGNTITNSLDTVLDGSGHQVMISGSNAVRVFYVATNVSFRVLNLTIANGRSTCGAGILNDGGTVNLFSCTFRSNTVVFGVGDQGIIPPAGGALDNRSGMVNATNCIFVANAVQASGYIPHGTLPPAQGGAICNENGTVTLDQCCFTNNSASALSLSHPSAGLDATGGAIHNSGVLTGNRCVFVQNSALGASGENVYGYFRPDGGAGTGGAICNLGSLLFTATMFSRNCSIGGNASSGNYDYALDKGAPGGNGGPGSGGAIYNSGQMRLVACSALSNTCAGGSGGTGGGGIKEFDIGTSGGSGGNGGAATGSSFFNTGTFDFSNCTVASNTATGGAGGAGGAGFGGSVAAGGKGGSGSGGGYGFAGFTAQSMVNCTIAFNQGAGGAGGPGGNGGSAGWNGTGSGIGGAGGNGGNGGSGLATVSASATNCTLALNFGAGGIGGAGGTGGVYTGPSGHGASGPNGSPGTNGSAAASGISGMLLNTLLSGNLPANCSGAITDAGHNLSSDGSCTFSGVGSMNNTDPKLGPLADNSGPTWTMALLAGSPAINGGTSVGAPLTDQRGVARPQGPSVDIGAFEYQYVPMFLRAECQTSNSFWLQMAGLLPNQTFTLQVSSNLVNWSDLANLNAGTNGIGEFVDCDQDKYHARFYRMKFVP